MRVGARKPRARSHPTRFMLWLPAERLSTHSASATAFQSRASASGCVARTIGTASMSARGSNSIS